MTSPIDSAVPGKGQPAARGEIKSQPTDRPSRAAKAVYYLLLAVLFLYTLTVLIPGLVSKPGGDLDSNWIRAMNWARVHHLDFGNDFVFTYGPWGFAVVPEDPKIFLLAATIWSAFALAFFAAIVQIANFLTPSRWKAAMLLLAFIAGLLGISDQLPEVRLYFLAWVLFILHFFVDDRGWSRTKIALTICLALAGLTKFSITLMAVPVIGAITLEQLWRRRLPSYFLVYTISYLLWWLAAGQAMGSLGPYLHHSWMIAGGYGQGEGSAGSDEASDLTWFLFCSGLMLAAVGALLIKKTFRQVKSGSAIDQAIGQTPRTRELPMLPREKVILATAGLAGILWMLLKAGFVRHDNHIITAAVSLALLAPVLGAVIWRRTGFGIGAIAAALACAGSLYFAGVSWNKFDSDGLETLWWTPLEQFPGRALLALQSLGDRSVLSHARETDFERLQDIPLPAVDGSVDSYSTGQGILIAQDLNYQPRPVMTSYLAYTAGLSQLNADYLAGPKAPETILFRIESIDIHDPAQEDALSWPQILSRYDVKDAAMGWLMLRRSAQPRTVSVETIQQTEAPMGQAISIPASDDPIWVAIDVRSTIWGKLVGAAYRPAALLLRVKTADGNARTFRLLPDEARAGFLLSPVVGDNLSFAMLNSSNWKSAMGDQAVSAITVSADTPDGSSAEYQGEYGVTFSRLRLEHYDVSNVPGMSDYAHAGDLQRRARVVFSEGTPELVAVTPQKDGLFVPPRTQMSVDVPPNAQVLHLGFGLLDRSFTNDKKTAGVAFGAAAAIPGPDGQQQLSVLWGMKLDPVGSAADRGIHTVDIPLPNPPPPSIVLETVSQGSDFGNFAYWSDIEFK
jgi:hypothetical protein